jgi:hypothetical protein
LAIESIAAQAAEVGELQRRGLYDFAMLDAFKGNDGASKNTLPKSAHFAIYYPNLLIPVEDCDQMHFRGERFLFFFHSSSGSCWLHQLASQLLPSQIKALFPCFHSHRFASVILQVINRVAL